MFNRTLPGSALRAAEMEPPPLRPPPPPPPPPPPKKPARVDTLELKTQLFKRLGHSRSEVYFRSLKRFLGCQLDKGEFDKICKSVLGKENLKLHNTLIRGILSNSCMPAGPPQSNQAATGNSQTSAVSNGMPSGCLLPPKSVRPVASRDMRFADKPSPLGKSPLGNPGTGEFMSGGSKVFSVEDGEEVNQNRGSPLCVQSLSPITAPLGVATPQNSQPSTSRPVDACYDNGELPDCDYLSKVLEVKMKDQGLRVPRQSAAVLNSGMNAYIGQMLKACLVAARARVKKEKEKKSQANESAAPHVNNGQNHTYPSGPANASAAPYVNNGQNHTSHSGRGYHYEVTVYDLWDAVNARPRLTVFAQQWEKIASHVADG